MHCDEITGPFEETIIPFSTWPQIFKGSLSLFSSSPFINGITLSIISGQLSKVLPAPDIA
jgi:hypothetical protein